jgi:hypothetical protein
VWWSSADLGLVHSSMLSRLQKNIYELNLFQGNVVWNFNMPSSFSRIPRTDMGEWNKVSHPCFCQCVSKKTRKSIFRILVYQHTSTLICQVESVSPDPDSGIFSRSSPSANLFALALCQFWFITKKGFNSQFCFYLCNLWLHCPTVWPSCINEFLDRAHQEFAFGFQDTILNIVTRRR